VEIDVSIYHASNLKLKGGKEKRRRRFINVMHRLRHVARKLGGCRCQADTFTVILQWSKMKAANAWKGLRGPCQGGSQPASHGNIKYNSISSFDDDN